jgi:hypothetical protein
MRRYHHIGIPTNDRRDGETYLERFKVHVSGYETGEYGIEWMRFEPDSPLPELVKTVPHVAFEVDDLEEAISGGEILIEPNSPSEGVRVAFVVENGAPVEFLEIESSTAGTGGGAAVPRREATAPSEKTARSFVDAINAGSIGRLAALMTDDHTFIDSDGKEHSGRARMLDGWREYFALVPDYRIDVKETFSRGDTVVLLGIAEGTFRKVPRISWIDAPVRDGASRAAETPGADDALDPANRWSVPAVWRAVVLGGRVSVWRLYVNPEPMLEILRRMGLA